MNTLENNRVTSFLVITYTLEGGRESSRDVEGSVHTTVATGHLRIEVDVLKEVVTSVVRVSYRGLLESAGFSRSNPYYIVKQGKVRLVYMYVYAF